MKTLSVLFTVLAVLFGLLVTLGLMHEYAPPPANTKVYHGESRRSMPHVGGAISASRAGVRANKNPSPEVAQLGILTGALGFLFLLWKFVGHLARRSSSATLVDRAGVDVRVRELQGQDVFNHGRANRSLLRDSQRGDYVKID